MRPTQVRCCIIIGPILPPSLAILAIVKQLLVWRFIDAHPDLVGLRVARIHVSAKVKLQSEAGVTEVAVNTEGTRADVGVSPDFVVFASARLPPRAAGVAEFGVAAASRFFFSCWYEI
jgi:hypothetical protein